MSRTCHSLAAIHWPSGAPSTAARASAIAFSHNSPKRRSRTSLSIGTSCCVPTAAHSTIRTPKTMAAPTLTRRERRAIDCLTSFCNMPAVPNPNGGPLMAPTPSTRAATARLAPRLAGLLVTLIAALVPFAAGSRAARADDGGGFVYVMTNEGGIANHNAVRAFRRNAQGVLKELPGSPFLTGGTGVHPSNILGPFDSDQCMILDRDRDRLFAVNGGSDTIAVFDVKHNGNLAAVPGSPFDSGGVNPASVGLSDDGILMVANKDFDLGRPGFDATRRQGNYATFRVNPKGKLIPVRHGTVPAGPVGGKETPTQALVIPGLDLAFDANFFGLMVRSFAIEPNGRLDPVDSQPIETTAGPPVPLGLASYPSLPILYVGFVLDQAIGVYVYDEDGNFTFVNTVNNVGSGPCWLLPNADGSRMYVSNNFENKIGVFDITHPLDPVKIQTFTLPQGAGNAAPFQLALDEDNRFLHVVTQATPGQDPAV